MGKWGQDSPSHFPRRLIKLAFDDVIVYQLIIKIKKLRCQEIIYCTNVFVLIYLMISYIPQYINDNVLY
jgi:hypothetical protein